MRIRRKNRSNLLQIYLDWSDIEELKEGEAISENYDVEHKVAISVVPENFNVPNWTETKNTSSLVKFDEILQDFFINLSLYDVRCSFISTKNLEIGENPYCKGVQIYFPA